jgi:uncharacterized sulfatase
MSGYDRDTTPNIQSVADRSDAVSFSSCFSHARSSPASVPSILSGTYPSRHRTYFGNRNQFPDELPLVSELLSDAGYRTVGLSNNGYASSLTGVDRGFDEFTLLGSTPMEILRSAGIRSVLKYLANIRRHSVGLKTDFHAHSGAYLVNEITERQVSHADEPFFLYVHYNEPHRAYYPPLPFLDRFTDELPMSSEAAATLSMEVHHNLVEIVANGCELDADDMAALKAMYDGEIAYTDERVGELYETIQRELGETIIVITADHGELFGEDEMLAHKYSMHNAVLNVPMVIQGLSELSDGGIIQHSDVMRTLLEVAGAETQTIQGVDLRTDTRKYAISQSPPGSIEPLLENNPEFDQSKFPTDAYSVIQDKKFKYVARPDEPRLYQLPNESSDLHDEYPKRAKQMKKELSEWLSTDGSRVGTGENINIDEQMRSRLADLGYLDHEM